MNCKVCRNLSVKNPSLSFFRFPSDYNRCKDWAKRCGILPAFDKYGPGKFNKSFRICSEHFESKHVVFDGRKRKLLSCAVPKEIHKKEGFGGIANESKNTNLQPRSNSCFTLKPFRNLCRFCAEEDTKLTEIFSWKGKTLKLEEKLKVFPIRVNRQDELPLKICRQCIVQISKFYDFIKGCLRANVTLKKILRRTKHKLFGNDSRSGKKSKLPDTKRTDTEKPVPHHDSSTVVDTVQHKEKHFSATEYKKPRPLKPRFSFLRYGVQQQQASNETSDVNEPEKYQSNKEEKVGTKCSGEDEVPGTVKGNWSKESVEDKNTENICHAKCESLNRNKYTCSKCFKIFCSSEILQSHEKAHSIEPDELGRFICQTCGKLFPNKYRLNEHNRVHTGECPFICYVCDKRFHKGALLRQHTMIHESDKRFACSVCDFKSSRKGNLIQHVKKHYKKLQNGNSDAQTNKQSHSGSEETTERKRIRLSTESLNTGCVPMEEHPQVDDMNNEQNPYQNFNFMCGICGKLCLGLGTLENHFKIHTEQNSETPHDQKTTKRRAECKKPATKTNSALKKDERKFQCGECGVKFKRRDTLAIHFRIHTGERPYMCKICGFTFKQRGDCLKHERNHSKENDGFLL